MRNPKDWSLLSLPLLPHSASSSPSAPAPSQCATLSGLWTLVRELGPEIAAAKGTFSTHASIGTLTAELPSKSFQ